MFREFKEFATRGNITDMAIGIIIGGAFQKIVNSLVNDIIMPLISIVTGKVDYTTWVIQIGSMDINIGIFITNIVNFFMIAFSIFLIIKYINKLNKKLEKVTSEQMDKLNKKLHTDKFFKKKKRSVPAPTTKKCPFCFSIIPIQATRCSNCTSHLLEEKSEMIENQIQIKEE